jgi:Integrase core domain
MLKRQREGAAMSDPVRLEAGVQMLAETWGVTPSMSRKGNHYDNALAESFVATLKTECFADSIPPTKAVAKLMVFDYIETFYNTRRRHSALDYRSPAQFEHHSLCSQRQVVLKAAAGNNPVQSPKGFQCSSQTINLN